MMTLEPLLIDKSDFTCVTQVARHCDWDQLSIYIREQQNLSLLPKIGSCLFDKILSYSEGICIKGDIGSCTDEESDVLRHLLIGGRYKACDGTTKMHFGLKRSLVHWAYGAYIYRHGIVDTSYGAVQKMNQDSVPIDLKDLSKLNVEHRSNAEYYFKMTLDFLCSIKDSIAIKDCQVCECIKDCKCNTCCKNHKKETLQRRGVRIKTVTKYE